MPAMLLAGEVWHYWIAVALAIPAVLAVPMLILGYLRKVQSLKYPKR